MAKPTSKNLSQSTSILKKFDSSKIALARLPPIGGIPSIAKEQSTLVDVDELRSARYCYQRGFISGFGAVGVGAKSALCRSPWAKKMDAEKVSFHPRRDSHGAGRRGLNFFFEQLLC
jgi:hypothetical protein